MNWKTGTGSPGVGQAIAVCAALVAVQFAVADTAVDIVDNDPFTPVFPAGGTTFGWQFSVKETIEITHIGLYDNNSDGFEGEHPIGLWDEEGSLIWSDVIEAGSSLPLVDLFRYIDLDPPTLSGKSGTITVTPGQEYTIGFYSAEFLLSEGMLTRFGEEVLIHDAINYLGHGVGQFTNGLEIPTNALSSHAFGPNFMFNVIPAPPSLALLGLCLATPRRRRR